MRSSALAFLIMAAACGPKRGPTPAEAAHDHAPAVAGAAPRQAAIDAGAAEPVSSGPPARLAGSIRPAGAGRYDVAPLLARHVAAGVLGSLDAPELDGALVILTVEDGAITGLTLHQVEPLSALAALGLQSGDVIESVNGVAIAGASLAGRDRVIAALEEALGLAAGSRGNSGQPPDEVRLGVRRGGSALTVAFRRAEDLGYPTAEPSVADEIDPAELRAQLSRAIRRRGEHRYDVDGHALAALLSHPEVLAREARLVPALRNGEAIGMRIFAVRRGSVFASLGLQNGDTLRRVNGHELGDPAHALEAYTGIREADEIRLEIERRGQPITLVYRVVR